MFDNDDDMVAAPRWNRTAPRQQVCGGRLRMARRVSRFDLPWRRELDAAIFGAFGRVRKEDTRRLHTGSLFGGLEQYGPGGNVIVLSPKEGIRSKSLDSTRIIISPSDRDRPAVEMHCKGKI